VGEKTARDVLAYLAEMAPWYARGVIERLLKNVSALGIEVSVTLVKARRNLDQNALIHAYFDLLARHTGHTADEVKAYLKQQFLPFVKEGKLGPIHKGTSELSIGEMAEFITQVQAWAVTELGVILPSNPKEWAAADFMPTVEEVRDGAR
jgi:hypothetical protein